MPIQLVFINLVALLGHMSLPKHYGPTELRFAAATMRDHLDALHG
jgi:hypothetical protein